MGVNKNLNGMCDHDQRKKIKRFDIENKDKTFQLHIGYFPCIRFGVCNNPLKLRKSVIDPLLKSDFET